MNTKKSEYTPKAWGIGIYDNNSRMVVVEGADTVAQISFPGYEENTDKEKDAMRNKRGLLIATAPELLEALKLALAEMEAGMDEGYESVRDVKNKLRAAIAKAEGK